ncbi:HEAT repeat domain-containing protein [Actinomadura rubrisoli]|uniref:HEAT repeat domain-containing protein n=1 Tax=Actinomadura rubrisoli TaxID=2530368 RepID=A0A4R5BRV0_9ACTN|nr:HEAT repeat domain-containing protein [Actinomadura rubrisoli]TDD88729.1 HEAT repeat domain-containing protein [Actinomadura rubrisoli]
MSERAGREEEPATRPSTFVSREGLPGVRAREEVNELLRAHDPEVAEENLARLTDEHSPLLRQIARERDVSARDPHLRRNAITALGRVVSVENLNVLAELAALDDDELIRASALTVLAGTGLRLAVPLLADAQESRSPVEAAAGAKGLAALADRLGTDAVEAALRPGQRQPGPAETSGGETEADPSR